jgi:hypothetical protein
MKLLTVLALLLALLTGACIQMPSEKQEVADLRPQFSFALADPGDDLGQYQVFIDELHMGTASAYAAGKSALKVLSGTHVIRVEGRGRVVVQERVYLGDGATRTILIPKP